MAKPKTSIFLCCFGSSHAMESPTQASHPISKMTKNKKKKKKKKITTPSWFSWRRIRFNNNSVNKTVPLGTSISDHAHYSKSRSKSTLQNKLQAPATNPPPPPQPASVLPGTPYYTPTQTRHGANNVEDTRQQARGSPAGAKRQERRLSSLMQRQTTAKKDKNARSSYEPVVGMSVVVVTLVIMIFWGRLCAILCTSVWLYCTPRFIRKSGVENDDEDRQTTKSKDVDLDLDLDSEEYKKKVIMEGLLERNHRATTL